MSNIVDFTAAADRPHHIEWDGIFSRHEDHFTVDLVKADGRHIRLWEGGMLGATRAAVRAGRDLRVPVRDLFSRGNVEVAK